MAVVELMAELSHVAEGRQGVMECFSVADAFTQFLNNDLRGVANDALKMVVLSEQPQSEKIKMLVELICKESKAFTWTQGALTKPSTSEMAMAAV